MNKGDMLVGTVEVTIFYIFIIICTSCLASTKGRGPILWGFLSFLFGPLCLLLLLCLKNLNND
jgi:hypothetical protein